MALAEEFPMIPHARAGVGCRGCIVPVTEGALVTLQCNECGLRGEYSLAGEQSP